MEHLSPQLAAKARLKADPITGKPALLYPEGILLLNETAAAILELCDGNRDVDGIVLALVERFKSPGPMIRSDVEQTLSHFKSKGLLEMNPSNSGPALMGQKKVDSQVPSHTDRYRPFGLLAELTYRCPLHCPYCSNPVGFPAGRIELTTGEWKRVFKEAVELGVLHALFSGGEPLQRMDLEELVQDAKEKGLYTNLITSALGFSPERAKKLKAAGLDSIQISFQASEAPLADQIAGTKAHRHKLEAAKLAEETGFPLTVNTVLHRANIDQLDELIALAEGLGAHRLELANTQYYGWAFQNQALLLPTRGQVERAAERAARARARLHGKMEIIYVVPDYYATRPKPCMNGWGRRYLTVNPVGEVLPCPTAGGIKKLRFENVREKELGWIWRESEAFNLFRGTEWMPDPCKSCDQREVDFGGCRCQATLLTGNAAHTDPACDLSPYRESLTKLVEAARKSPASPGQKFLYQYRVNP